MKLAYAALTAAALGCASAASTNSSTNSTRNTDVWLQIANCTNLDRDRDPYLYAGMLGTTTMRVRLQGWKLTTTISFQPLSLL